MKGDLVCLVRLVNTRRSRIGGIVSEQDSCHSERLEGCVSALSSSRRGALWGAKARFVTVLDFEIVKSSLNASMGRS